jgi:hypothetical protein
MILSSANYNGARKLDRVTCYTWERKKEAQVENLKKQHTPSFKTKVALEAAEKK